MKMTLSDHYDFSDLVGCSCGTRIHELDVMTCEQCNDACCEYCYVECGDCKAVICNNCAMNSESCIKCAHNKKYKSKAYLVINGKNVPFKDSQRLISLTSSDVRPIIFNIDDTKFKISHRTICVQKESAGSFDYFIYVDEVVEVADGIYARI